MSDRIATVRFPKSILPRPPLYNYRPTFFQDLLHLFMFSQGEQQAGRVVSMIRRSAGILSPASLT